MSKTHLSSLPLEHIELIGSFLSYNKFRWSVRSLCREFRLCQALHQVLVLTKFQASVRFAACYPNLRQLTLKNIPQIIQFQELGPCPSLTELILDGCLTTTKLFSWIAGSQVTTLRLKDTNLCLHNNESWAMPKLLNLSFFEYFYFKAKAGVSRIVDPLFLQGLLLATPNLKSLVLKLVPQSFSAEVFSAIISELPCLTSLGLRDIPSHLVDADTVAFVQRLSQLDLSLVRDGRRVFNTTGLDKTKMRALSLSADLASQFVFDLGEFTNLYKLNLVGPLDAHLLQDAVFALAGTLCQLGLHFVDVTHLDLSPCVRLVKFALEKTWTLQALHLGPNLQEITLDNLAPQFVMDCRSFSPTCLRQLVVRHTLLANVDFLSNCAQLKSLTLDNLAFDNSALDDLMFKAGKPRTRTRTRPRFRLENLDLANVLLDDRVFAWLVSGNALVSLHLRQIRDLTDASLFVLAKQTNLETLVLVQGSRFSTQGLTALASLLNLETLTIRGCWHVTERLLGKLGPLVTDGCLRSMTTDLKTHGLDVTYLDAQLKHLLCYSSCVLV